jgi:transposase
MWLNRGVCPPEVRLPVAASDSGEERDDVITIGIDPHKTSVTAAALGPGNEILAHRRLAYTAKTATQLLAWADRWPERSWAVEGAAGLGLGVAQQLVAAGERVVDVPAKLAARARLLGPGSGRKTDLADAVSVSMVASGQINLRQVDREDDAVVLRLLSDRRDDLVAERTRTLNRLHVLLRDLAPGGAPRDLSTPEASRFLAATRPVTAADIERKRIARALLDDLRRSDRQLKAIGKTIETTVAATSTTLTEVFGIGAVLAAKIAGHTGDITRFASKAHFASYSGTAPIEASSGDLRRHRLNRSGNRQLNTALHTAALCQIRSPGPGQDHYRRKLAELKSPREAQRSLKRQLSNVVYRHLLNDHRRRHAAHD